MGGLDTRCVVRSRGVFVTFRTVSLLALLSATLVACAATPAPTPQMPAPRPRTAVVVLGPECRTTPPERGVPVSEVLSVRLRTHRLVYELAVMNREERGHYPPPNPCFLEGVEGEEATVYLRAHEASAVSITTLEPSELPGQMHHNVSGVVLPQSVTYAGQAVHPHTFCFPFMGDITVSRAPTSTEHRRTHPALSPPEEPALPSRLLS